ncbi:MAG TPA: RodZ domain-containing protein [Methylomirabilota bacterium]
MGSYLRELRQQRGLSLDEMARSTRVASRYLEALENDDFRALPAPVFTRGFIRAYCQVLRESPDEALRRFGAGTGGAVAAPGPAATASTVAEAIPSLTTTAAPTRSDARGRGPILVSFVLLVVLGVALFAVTLALQKGRERGGDRRMAGASAPPAVTDPAPLEPVEVQGPVRPAPSPAETRPAPSAASEARPRPAVTPSPATGASPGPSLVGAVGATHRLVARTSELTWIRVRTEDGRMTEENVPPGQIREWVSNGRFTLTVGNAGGVALELNGRALPPLGASGEVIERLVLPADPR